VSRYKTFWWRVLAGYIDGIVFAPIQIVDHYANFAGRSRPVLIAWMVFSFVAPWLYSVVMHACYGQTLGKMVARVKVLDVSEERLPSLEQAYLRDIGSLVLGVFAMAYLIHLVVLGVYDPNAEIEGIPGDIISWSFSGWFFLEIFTMWTNDKRRALHDYIAGTVVVRIRKT
jgi:uncharacterized RDD family membrane protein YckC